MCKVPLIYKILEKEKYISHTNACQTIFTHAFCQTHVENLLKGPEDNLVVDNIYM